MRELKRRIGEQGISAEEEHRVICAKALEGTPSPKKLSFKNFLRQMPDVGEDSIFERDRSLSGRTTEQQLCEEEV